MTDEEILTKRLTDWKPETDIRLQKAFGKFVEEAGELLEITGDITGRLVSYAETIEFENELADTLAFIRVINIVTDRSVDLPNEETITEPTIDQLYADIVKSIGVALNIVGRCQIQGVKGKHPEGGQPNIVRLEIALYRAEMDIYYCINTVGLDIRRIEQRKQAKIDSKLPWIMGTATDLLPDL